MGRPMLACRLSFKPDWRVDKVGFLWDLKVKWTWSRWSGAGPEGECMKSFSGRI